MPTCTAVASSCAKVIPPTALTSQTPWVPSDPVPDSTTRDGAAALVLGQRVEEEVDREMRAPPLASRGHVEEAARQRELRIGRNHIDVIRLHRLSVLGLATGIEVDRCSRSPQPALMGGVEVLDQDEGHPGVGRQVRQEQGERLEPAGRGADADDGKGSVLGYITEGTKTAAPGHFRVMRLPGRRRVGSCPESSKSAFLVYPEGASKGRRSGVAA